MAEICDQNANTQVTCARVSPETGRGCDWLCAAKKRKAGHKAPASTLSGADWKAATERIAGEFNGVGRGVLSGKKNFMRRFGSAWLEVSCG